MRRQDENWRAMSAHGFGQWPMCQSRRIEFRAKNASGSCAHRRGPAQALDCMAQPSGQRRTVTQDGKTGRDSGWRTTMTRLSRGPRRNRCEGREIIIDDKIVRKVAEQYLRYGDSGLGEADCWRFAIQTVGGEQFTHSESGCVSCSGHSASLIISARATASSLERVAL